MEHSFSVVVLLPMFCSKVCKRSGDVGLIQIPQNRIQLEDLKTSNILGELCYFQKLFLPEYNHQPQLNPLLSFSWSRCSGNSRNYPEKVKDSSRASISCVHFLNTKFTTAPQNRVASMSIFFKYFRAETSYLAFSRLGARLHVHILHFSFMFKQFKTFQKQNLTLDNIYSCFLIIGVLIKHFCFKDYVPFQA